MRIRRYVSDTPARIEIIKARVTPAEKRALEDAARARNITLAELLRGAGDGMVA